MAGENSLPPSIAPGKLGWRNHYRLVLSQFPPIALFEDYVDPELLSAAFAIEARTNPRLRAEAGDLTLIPNEDYVLGPGASPVMAAFTHIGRPSRFTDGSFGIYYAASTLGTAIAEVKFHRSRFLAATNEPPTQLTLRSYVGTVKKPLLDIRSAKYRKYHDPSLKSYAHCQKFSIRLRSSNAWGLAYPSVRDPNGQCVAFYRAPGAGIPRQGKHLSFHWDGHSINNVYEIRKWRSRT